MDAESLARRVETLKFDGTIQRKNFFLALLHLYRSQSTLLAHYASISITFELTTLISSLGLSKKIKGIS